MSTYINPLLVVIKDNIVVYTTMSDKDIYYTSYDKDAHVFVEANPSKPPFIGWGYDGEKFFPTEIPEYANGWDYENWRWDITHFKREEINNG